MRRESTNQDRKPDMEQSKCVLFLIWRVVRRWSFCTAEREILYIFKNLKDDMSAGLVAAEKGG